MLNTWTLTVLGEMDSSLTMSRLPLPAATSRSTSISYSDRQRYVRNAPEHGRAKRLVADAQGTQSLRPGSADGSQPVTGP